MGMNKMPRSLNIADPLRFDWNSAFWTFDLLANYAYGLYDPIIKEIQTEQFKLENRAHIMSAAVDKAAESLYAAEPTLMVEYLTDFSVNNAEFVVNRWRNFSHEIFSKFNDRYIRDENTSRPSVRGIGYPDHFLERAVKERPGYFDVKWKQRLD
jgi:dipeptidase